MKLQHHVPPFNLCVGLAEKGYPQNASNFYWAHSPENPKVATLVFFEWLKEKPGYFTVICAAPTAAELCQQMPMHFILERGKEGWTSMRRSSILGGGYSPTAISVVSETQAEAAARVLLYAIEKEKFDPSTLVVK